MSSAASPGSRSRFELLRIFTAVMDHYNAPRLQRQEAWAVALQHPYRAWACYSAILRSLYSEQEMLAYISMRGISVPSHSERNQAGKTVPARKESSAPTLTSQRSRSEYEEPARTGKARMKRPATDNRHPEEESYEVPNADSRKRSGDGLSYGEQA